MRDETQLLQRAYFDCVRGLGPLHATWLSHA